MRTLRALAAAILTVAAVNGYIPIVAPAHAAAPALAVNPIVLDYDDGGAVDTFLMWYQRVRDSGVPVRIRGLCQSACTLVMILPPEQVCIERTGSLGFHLFSTDGRADLNMTQAYMRRYYPDALQERLGKQKLSESMWFMSAAEAVELGIVRACDVNESDD